MSKALVQKALSLLQEDVETDYRSEKFNLSSKKNKKLQRKQNSKLMVKTSNIGKNYAKVDRTEENLKILKQLRILKPKSSVSQKVIEYYAKQSVSEEPAAKPEIQKSILFDDDDEDEDDKKRRKRRKHS